MQNIIRIMDFAAPELDVYARLSERQLLNLEGTAGGLFIAESPRVISRALDAGYVPVSALMAEEASDPQTRELLARLGPVPVYTAPFHVLKQLTGFPLTRGMLCAMERTALASVEEICKNARRVAVLEHVMNPTNVGAIFRSAAALSMDAVLLTPDCSDPLYRRAVRVSMGTVFQIPWTYLSRSFFADSSYMLSFSVLCSCVCSRLISPSVSSWHKQDNTLMHQSPGHIQRRTPYNF